MNMNKDMNFEVKEDDLVDIFMIENENDTDELGTLLKRKLRKRLSRKRASLNVINLDKRKEYSLVSLLGKNSLKSVNISKKWRKKVSSKIGRAAAKAEIRAALNEMAQDVEESESFSKEIFMKSSLYKREYDLGRIMRQYS